jgi:hypothetical protein
MSVKIALMAVVQGEGFMSGWRDADRQTGLEGVEHLEAHALRLELIEVSSC